ncbi:MAG TPA: META domain-containing protein [Rhodothermales bacterium]|nr:META domain-containing protein [Rhodothermales bacterium]
MKKILFASAVLLLFGNLAGCDLTNALAPDRDLTDTTWHLTSMGTWSKGSEDITLQFRPDSLVEGTGECNVYGGLYEADADGSLSIHGRDGQPGVGSTKVYCPGGVKYDDYIRRLPAVESYSINGNHLTIKGKDHTILTFKAGPAPKSSVGFFEGED